MRFSCINYGEIKIFIFPEKGEKESKMRKAIFLMVVMMMVGVFGCASAQKQVLTTIPVVAESKATGEVWGPAPTQQEADSMTPVYQTVALVGDAERTEALKSIIGSYWGVKDFSTQSGTNKEVIVTGIGGTKTVPISDKLLANLNKVIGNKMAGESLNSLCPTQAGLLREALGDMKAYQKGICPDGNCQSARVLKKCQEIGKTSDGIIILVCDAQGKPEGTTAGKWCFAPEHGGWVRQLMVYLTYAPNENEYQNLIPSDSAGVWKHLEEISSWNQFPPNPKRWDSCKYKSFSPGE